MTTTTLSDMSYCMYLDNENEIRTAQILVQNQIRINSREDIVYTCMDLVGIHYMLEDTNRPI